MLTAFSESSIFFQREWIMRGNCNCNDWSGYSPVMQWTAVSACNSRRTAVKDCFLKVSEKTLKTEPNLAKKEQETEQPEIAPGQTNIWAFERETILSVCPPFFLVFCQLSSRISFATSIDHYFQWEIWSQYHVWLDRDWSIILSTISTQPTLTQLPSFKICRTTLLNNFIQFGDLLILRLENCERVGRADTYKKQRLFL